MKCKHHIIGVKQKCLLSQLKVKGMLLEVTLNVCDERYRLSENFTHNLYLSDAVINHMYF